MSENYANFRQSGPPFIDFVCGVVPLINYFVLKMHPGEQSSTKIRIQVVVDYERNGCIGPYTNPVTLHLVILNGQS